MQTALHKFVCALHMPALRYDATPRLNHTSYTFNNIQMNNNKNLTGTITAILVLLLLAGTAAGYAIIRSEQNNACSAGTEQQAAIEVQRILPPMETNLLAGLATNDKELLKAYATERPELKEKLLHLSQYATRSQAQGRLDQVTRLTKELASLDYFWEDPSINPVYHSDSARKSAARQVKDAADSVNAEMNAILSAENTATFAAWRKVNDATLQTLIASGGGLLIILITVIVLSRRGRRSNAQPSDRQEKDGDATNTKYHSNATAAPEDTWLLNSIRQINTGIDGHYSTTSLLQASLNKLSACLNAAAGAAYVKEPGTQVLHRTATLPGATSDNHTATIGEGMVGAAAARQEVSIVRYIPAEHWEHGNNADGPLPDTLVLAPLWHNGNLTGMLELGCQENEAERYSELLKEVSTNIAMGIDYITTAEQLRRMAAEHREVVHERDELARSLADTSTAAAQHMEKATRQDITGKHPAEVMAYISEALSSSLNNIVGMTRQLKEDRSGNVSPKQAEYAGIIYKSGSDLLNLVNDIAYLSEAEAWNTELVFEQVKIKDVAYTIGQVFGPLSKEHNIKFSIHIQNVTDRITTDKTQLEEIIRHLLFNAFKFTPEEGEVKLIFAVHDQSLEIAVSDTGIGIPADEQLLIIENFRRPMGSRSRIPGAKGKGLQISNELARRMNGEIKIWSKINEGSTFTVMLPLDGGILATKQIRN